MHTHQTTTITPVVAAAYDLTAGRLGASLSAVFGLVGIALGVLAFARLGHASATGPPDASPGRRQAHLSLGLGAVAFLAGSVIVATADGGLGSGSGIGGAIVAIVLGTASMVLGGLASVRGRRLA